VRERERALTDLRGSLRGSRSARSRLIEEIEAHLDDALAAGDDTVLDRIGSPSEIASAWNDLQWKKRRRMRRTLASVSLAVACTAALGVTQYASGRSHVRPFEHHPAQHERPR
jgi:uncharacterized membrane protein